MAWKSLSPTQFKADLIALGFQVTGSGNDPSKWTYTYNGQNINYNVQLMAKLSEVAPLVYYVDEKGYHYVQDPGTVAPPGTPPPVTSDQFVTYTPTPYVAPEPTGGGAPPPSQDSGGGAPEAPAPSDQGGQWSQDMQQYLFEQEQTNPFEQVGITYGSTVESIVQSDPTMDGQTLQNQLKWQEDAAYSAAVYGPILAEAFGLDYASQDWYLLASGAQGSGLMRAKIAEAQNRIAFREAWRMYNNGADPGPSDYDWVTGNYVSPNEYATRMAAKESAKKVFDKINELLMRTLNHSVTLAELENMVVGGKDSGVLEALIDEATRLDAFTDELYQFLGHIPTADDYAREVAKFPSVDAFKWEITVAEQIKQLGDDINETLQRAGQRRYSEQELRIMLGKSEGWGELQKGYDEALKDDEREQRSRVYGMTAEKISPVYTSAFQGGFKEALPELPDLGAM